MSSEKYLWSINELDKFVGTFVLEPSMDENFMEMCSATGVPKPVTKELYSLEDRKIQFQWREDGAFLIHGLLLGRKEPIIYRPHQPFLCAEYLGWHVKLSLRLDTDGALVESGFNIRKNFSYEVRRWIRGNELIVEIDCLGHKAKRVYRRITSNEDEF